MTKYTNEIDFESRFANLPFALFSSSVSPLLECFSLKSFRQVLFYVLQSPPGDSDALFRTFKRDMRRAEDEA